MTSQTIQIPIRGKQSLKIVNTYQSADKTIDEGHFKYIKHNPNIIYVGDINAKMTHPLHNNTNDRGRQLDDLTDKGFIRTHTPETYTRYDDSGRAPSILDIAITSPRFPHDIKTEVGPNIGSDHRPVFITINTAVNRIDNNIHTATGLRKSRLDILQADNRPTNTTSTTTCTRPTHH